MAARAAPLTVSTRAMNIGHMRTDYARGQLRRDDLHADPFAQFALWFDEACRASLPEPNAVSLATVGADGCPLVRTVLVKHFDASGCIFYTNLESRKARQIEENPNVALMFPWLALERQVIVTGVAQKISAGEALRYFVRRPLESQLAAWASPQSRRISSRAVLEMKWEEMKRKFADGQVPLPSFWGGFRVVPRTMEFWQGRASRLHDRFLYTREEGGWLIERLAP